MIDRDEYNACISYARRTSHEQGRAEGLAEGETLGAAKERKKNVARDKKIAKFLRSKGVSPKILAAALAIK